MDRHLAWEFKTARFTVRAFVTDDLGYQYDGDDPDGEIQDALYMGDMIAFDTDVIVYLDGREIGRDSLGASVYHWNDWQDFFTAHRGEDPMDRNCSIMRAARGGNVAICHYFPDMVSEAVREARQHLQNLPQIRKEAA